MHIMFIPVGEQTEPIYEGFRHVKEVDKVYLLASGKTEKYAVEIRDKIGAIYKTEIIKIHPEKLDDIMEKLMDIIAENKDKKIISNITGGTKVMSHA